MKRNILFLLVISSSILSAYSDSRSSANHSITTEAVDRGGKRSTSADFTHDGSVGLISGKSNTASGSVVAESGYVGQLEPDSNTPLTVVSVVSRKTHGGSGTFDINLPLTGVAGVECRTGGAGGNHQIVVTFATPVSVGGVSVTSIDGQAAGTRSVNGAVVTISLSGVANAQTIGITLIGVNNGASTGNVVVSMGVLVGDTTGSGFVNSGDAAQTRSRSGQTTDATNFRSDVNTDGLVNSGDTTVVRARSGTFLP